MKFIAIGACLGAMAARAFEIDTDIDTYGTLSGSFAKASINSYKLAYADLDDATGEIVGELLLQTGWVYIPGTETAVYHLGLEVYRTDTVSFTEEDLGLFWAFPVADFSDTENRRWEIGLVRKNVSSSSITY